MIDVIHWTRPWPCIVLWLMVVATISRISVAEDPFPMQRVPIMPFPGDRSPNFTKWTPQNWTTHFSTGITISNNLYLLQIHNGNAFHVVIPETDFQRIQVDPTSWSTARMRHSVISSSKKAAMSQLRASRRMGRSLQRTSQQSQRHQCAYAMNGGPFQRDGSLCGVVVVENGTLVASDFGPMVGFGMAQSKSLKNASADSSFWIMGRFESAEQMQEWNVQQFVTGFDWLVYDDYNIAAYRNNTTGAARAARSALGVKRDGTLLLVVSDGCEHW